MRWVASREEEAEEEDEEEGEAEGMRDAREAWPKLGM